jgi:SAM-dependent methyltransferase
MSDRDRYVQFGCGWTAPETWTNFDASPTLRFERLPVVGKLWTPNAQRFPRNVRYGDVLRGLPLAAGSARAVYSSHVLEHLPRNDVERAIGEAFRVLEPGGTFRMVVPDLEHAARGYLRALEGGGNEGNDSFMRETVLGLAERPRGLLAFLRSWLGGSAHLWMWDWPSLRRLFEQVGFEAIRRAEFGDADDPRFADVEAEDRFRGAVAVEGRKPGAQERRAAA